MSFQLGVHQSSLDTNGVREAFRALLAAPDGAAYMRALCHLLLVDFVCFDYKLPSACQNNSKVSSGRLPRVVRS